MLEQIRIVLIHTSHPGNIGSAARAMKTMGLSQLYLVGPLSFPHPKADELAASAQDVLANAKVFDSLDAALADCSLIIGTSARTRSIQWPLQTPRVIAGNIANEVQSSRQPIAILFGCEQSGLSNAELERCHVHMHIPSNPDYSSLNLAAAVQIVCYELRVASLAINHSPITSNAENNSHADAKEMELFFAHLKRALVQFDFLKMRAPRKLMSRLRRLFLRARPDQTEMNILRGMLTAFEQGHRDQENNRTEHVS